MPFQPFVLFTVFFAVIVCVDLKAVSDAHITDQDDTVNINIKNGAGLRISSPAGEIIVPSERKNVRIKTIDVFEEKNSPRKDNEHLKIYGRRDNSGGNKLRSNYPWQQHVRPGAMTQLSNNYKGHNHEYEYVDDFFENSYEYYDDFRPNNEKSSDVQGIPNLTNIVQFLRELINFGIHFINGNYQEMERVLYSFLVKDLNTMRRLRICGDILSNELLTYARGTTIHGVPHLVAKRSHLLERVFWGVILCSAMYGAITLSIQNVSRYYANPTVVSIQKDYRNWFNPFPSVTACFVNKFDETFVDEYIEEKWGINETDSRYDYYKEFVLSVANISYQSVHKLRKFAKDESLNHVNFLHIAARVHPELTGNLVTFDTQRKTDWHLVITELGICFSVNTKIAKHFSYRVPGPNSTILGDDPSQSDEHILECHYLNGLCYARYDSDPDAPLNIYVHSYLDIAHATSETPLHVKESQELEINFKMQQTNANAKLRELRPSQRKCRFDDEPLHADFPAYSTSICYMDCRYRLAMKLCGCRPFFYHTFAGKLCDMKGLLCIADYSAEIMKPPIKLGCNCPEPCDIIRYLPQTPKVTMWEYGYFDQRLTFRWGLLAPTTKYLRNIIFGFNDLVVSIGGTLALFLGISFITAVEIFFFLINFISVILVPRVKQIKQQNFVITHETINVIKWDNRPMKMPHKRRQNNKTTRLDYKGLKIETIPYFRN